MLANLMALITDRLDGSEEDAATRPNSGYPSASTSRAGLALAVIAIAVSGHAQTAALLRRSVRGRHADAGPRRARPPSLRIHRVPLLPAAMRPAGRRRIPGQPGADCRRNGALPARGTGRHRPPAPPEAARRHR